MTDAPWPREEFLARIRRIGDERYHSLHPFHRLLHGGKLNHGQVQAWVLNRFYYQARIPLKDAALLSRMEDPDLRRSWRKRIEEHDGGWITVRVRPCGSGWRLVYDSERHTTWRRERRRP